MSLFDLATRAVRVLPAETAHRFTIDALKTGLAKPEFGLEDPRLAVRLKKSGLLLPNPVSYTHLKLPTNIENERDS